MGASRYGTGDSGHALVDIRGIRKMWYWLFETRYMEHYDLQTYLVVGDGGRVTIVRQQGM